jgi:hypothetical protein
MAFKPGQSGNPKGRPAEDRLVKRLAILQTKPAIDRLTQIMYSENEKAAVSAACALLDRAFGKPKQSVDVKGAVTLLDLLNATNLKPGRDTSSDQAEDMGIQH